MQAVTMFVVWVLSWPCHSR